MGGGKTKNEEGRKGVHVNKQTGFYTNIKLAVNIKDCFLWPFMTLVIVL